MRKDLSQIIASLINNIGGAQVTALGDFNNQDLMCEIAQSTCNGLSVLKENWPTLSQEEKEEIAAIILTLKTIYSYNDEIKKK